MTRRLLVIDDEVEICTLVGRVGNSCGFEISSSGDASQLTPEFIASHDVLVLDLMMPNIDGVEVIRTMGALTPRPALILMSGLDSRMLGSARQLAEAQGINVLGVLHKPFWPADVRRALDRILLAAPAASAVAKGAVTASAITGDEFEAALERGEIVVHFQPQVSLADGSWTGVEALARWQHPVRGLLYPDSFIPMAETGRFALRFTEIVMQRAIDDVKRLRRELGFSGSLSVNMPPTGLTDITFPERLLAMLADSGMASSSFILEVTESAIPQNPAVSLDIETRLKMRGVHLSIDDFGTGHSSLERLHDAPFDELKIDLVFVRNSERDPSARAIIENAIRLGHSLGMKVVAEGVETAGIVHLLRDMGCDIGQGYFISKPVPSEKLGDWLVGWGYRWQQEGMSPAERIAAPVPGAEPAPATQHARRRLLLVEDNEDNRALFAEYLEMHGYEVLTAGDGASGVARALAEQLDLILMDVQMPGMDGIEAIRAIRASGRRDSLPILVVTALAAGDDRKRCIEAGATDYVAKPVRLKELLKRVSALAGDAIPAQGASA